MKQRSLLWRRIWKKPRKKVESISEKLLKAQKQKQEYEARQIIEAYRKSGKSLQELMTFLDV